MCTSVCVFGLWYPSKRVPLL
ncbi:hypothetical protein Pint_30485 [Pistacia integerrima]|uniref:Uncharacterized protein n=1 Tax=Pistacia integerrima TaxID=434235 RepID=A0ACC0X0J3_9ROSI|nr:hypothetical protein Pint_30485 [Pistacia integerrima]